MSEEKQTDTGHGAVPRGLQLICQLSTLHVQQDHRWWGVISAHKENVNVKSLNHFNKGASTGISLMTTHHIVTRRVH